MRGISSTPTSQEHAPANDRDQKVAGLRDKLEGAVEMEQCEDVLHIHEPNMSRGAARPLAFS